MDPLDLGELRLRYLLRGIGAQDDIKAERKRIGNQALEECKRIVGQGRLDLPIGDDGH